MTQFNQMAELSFFLLYAQITLSLQNKYHTLILYVSVSDRQSSCMEDRE